MPERRRLRVIPGGRKGPASNRGKAALRAVRGGRHPEHGQPPPLGERCMSCAGVLEEQDEIHLEPIHTACRLHRRREELRREVIATAAGVLMNTIGVSVPTIQAALGDAIGALQALPPDEEILDVIATAIEVAPELDARRRRLGQLLVRKWRARIDALERPVDSLERQSSPGLS